MASLLVDVPPGLRDEAAKEVQAALRGCAARKRACALHRAATLAEAAVPPALPQEESVVQTQAAEPSVLSPERAAVPAQAAEHARDTPSLLTPWPLPPFQPMGAQPTPLGTVMMKQQPMDDELLEITPPGPRACLAAERPTAVRDAG